MKKRNLNFSKLLAKGTLVALGLVSTIDAFGQAQTLYLNSVQGDKLSLYGNRIDATNMYGFGVRDLTLYHKTPGMYAWLNNTNLLASDDQFDIFGKSFMHLSKDGNGSILTLREPNNGNSSNSGELRCLESLGNIQTGTLYGGYIKYDGSANDFELGTYNGTDKSAAITIERASRNVGIGTNSATERLVIEDDDAVLIIRDGATDNSANAAKIELLEYASGSYDGGGYIQWNGSTNQLILGTKNSGVDSDIFVVSRNGQNVGIGTTSNAALSSTYKLHVNGKVRAKEIVVETGWADFVFEKDYQLRTLEEVESYIGSNGHLPDVPSAKHIEENGVSVGEMEAILLQKIEELTLYMIEMKKQNAVLQAEINALK